MRKITSLAVALAAFGFSTAALAEDGAAAAASTDSGGMKVSAAALVGYGLGAKDEKTGDINYYGPGFGVRAGVNVSKFYFGGTFIYHLGGSKEAGGVKFKFGMQYYGVEAGYPIPMGGFNLTPYVGLGQIKAHGEACVTIGGTETCGSGESKSEIYLSPGLMATTTGKIFFGGDVRYTRVMTGDGDKGKASAPAIFGTVGMNF